MFLGTNILGDEILVNYEEKRGSIRMVEGYRKVTRKRGKGTRTHISYTYFGVSLFRSWSFSSVSPRSSTSVLPCK